jgi:CHAD domain-containing protein
MACDTAFRVVARRCLADLTANHEAACKGAAVAVHQMRVALTRLRTAILFFSPMVADSEQARIRHDLKWLNRHLGTLRDLDVAIERLAAIEKEQPEATPYHRVWNDKRAESHRELALALRSARYRRALKSCSAWIENGPWSINKGKQAVDRRAAPIVAYSLRKLERWQQKLLKRSRKLARMGTEQRHRVRLLNKKLSYAIACFEDLFADRRFAKLRAGLKHLRKAQRALGQLNDDARGRSLAATLPAEGGAEEMPVFGPKRKKKLIRTAARAYRKLAEL